MTNLWSRTPETAPKNPLFPNLESESFPSFNFFFSILTSFPLSPPYLPPQPWDILTSVYCTLFECYQAPCTCTHPGKLSSKTVGPSVLCLLAGGVIGITGPVVK